MVLRCTFYPGIGEKFDEGKLEVRPAGSFFTEPKGVRHFGMTKEGTVLYSSAPARRQQTTSKDEPALRGIQSACGRLALERPRNAVS